MALLLSIDKALLCGISARRHRMQFHQLKRRDFITLLGGALVARPVAAHAQGAQSLLRVGALMPEPGAIQNAGADDGLRASPLEAGWTVGQELRSTIAGNQQFRSRSNCYHGIACTGSVTRSWPLPPATLAAKAATGTIPIVFVAVSEPVAQTIVASLAHPGQSDRLYEFGRPLERSGWSF